ncbi:RCC1 domain-containing protein, partial [Bifidobacterium xylocopae]
TVDGFTLSPTKGPANTAGTHTTITPPTPPDGVHFTQISAGNSHSLAIGDDGNTYAWGYNSDGELGTGSFNTFSSAMPLRVSTPAGVRFVQVSAGWDHSLAIGDDGHAYSWGDNGYGELGSSDTGLARSVPERVTDPAPDTVWATISAGQDYSLAIDSDGHAYSWGWNQYGQLGAGINIGSSIDQPVRVTDPAPDTTWSAVSAGDLHGLAIDSDGHAYGWGNNEHGELGNGSSDRNPHPTPARVHDPAGQPNTTWTTISAGRIHSLAIDSDGHAYSWGHNDFGQLGNGSSDNSYTDHSTPARVHDPAPDTTWTAISAGRAHSLAIDNHGHAYSWGHNDFGELGNGSSDTNPHPTPGRVTDPAGQPNTIWTTISAGSEYSLAIDTNVHAYSWGRNTDGLLGDGSTTNSSIPVWVAVPQYTITGINVDGTGIGAADRRVNPTTGVWDTTMPSHTPATVNVTVTYRHQTYRHQTVQSPWHGITIGGGVQTDTVTLHYTYATAYIVRFSLGDAAGHTGSPTPADQHLLDGETITSPQDPEWEHHWLTGWAKADGSTWDFNTPVTSDMTLTAQWQAWQFTLDPISGLETGGNTLHITPPPNPPLPLRLTHISASHNHTLAIGSDGNTYAWGLNDYGQLGDGTTTNRNQPVRVHTPAGVRFTQISAGFDYSLAIGDDGHAYSWGWNRFGQLGDNSTTDRNTPVRVHDPAVQPNTTWTTISAGNTHSLAIDNHRHAYSWGDNQYGELGNGSSDTNPHPTPVRVHDPTWYPNTTWTTISAGGWHSLAINSNGYAYSWGRNNYGQLGSSDTNPHPTPVRVHDPTWYPNTTWRTINAGWNHSLAIDNNGYAYSWGRNDGGQLGNGSSDTNPHPTPARINDPTRQPNTTWTTISAGIDHNLAIDTNEHAYSWGRNPYGQLGTGSRDYNPHPTPARVHDPTPNTTWTTISAGWDHSLAIDNNNHAYSWGWNQYGQLGDNSNTDRLAPVPVGLRQIVVTGITLDRNDATPAPAWNTGSRTWDTTAPAHPAGTVPATIHWTLAGQPQTDYPLTYTYTPHYTLPKAGSIPIQRLSGGTLLLLTTLAALTMTAHQLSRRYQPGRHTTISA